MNLIIPDFAGDTTVQGDMMDYADSRRDVFCILSTPSGMDADEAVDYVRITLAKKSKYSAMYWPWVKVADPLASTRQLTVPAVAHIAGIYSRTDNTKNVSKSPAGTVDGALRGIVGLESNPGKGERDTVYPARINPLINTPQTGMAVWGTRTLSATNDAFKFIGAVRLFMFVEKSVFNSTQSYVFESIGPNLYTAIKGQLESFLRSLFQQGYLAGASPSQAYSVICDSTNNPPEVSNQGQVICDVGIAPNKPGEIIRFRLAQRTIS
jgi:phage tail sheath protein FI